MGPVRRQISRHAAPLRQNMTDAERALWFALRGRRLAALKFRRQLTIGSYIVDFCCLEKRLIVEVDGGQHNVEADRRRTAWLEGQEFRLVRFWNHEVIGNMDGVLETIVRIATAEDPHPNPLPQAGEGARGVDGE